MSEEIEENNHDENSLCDTLDHINSLFMQIEKKLDDYNSEEDRIFVEETTLNFLIFRLKKLIVNSDCPDKNIDFLADNVRDQLLKCKRIQ